MTSNLASDVIRDNKDKNKKEIDKKVWDVLHTYFRPEFLNRLDSVVIYNPLTVKEIVDIARLQLEKVKVRLAESNIHLEITDDLALYFAEHGYDEVFGARPLKRLIEEQLVDELAMRVIEGKLKPGDTVKPTTKEGTIVI